MFIITSNLIAIFIQNKSTYNKFNGDVYMNTQAISIISSFTLLLAMICVVAYADYKCIYSKLDRK